MSTENYLKGVLALFKSIQKTNSICNQYVVIINENISKVSEECLRKNHIQVIRKTSITIPTYILEKNKDSTSPNWNYTFDKFYIYDLIEFEKIIYLDSDMLVNKNIEELFDMPHMSATIAGKSYKGNEHWTKLNSGIMVVEPKEGIREDLTRLMIKSSNFRGPMGDQDIIEKYYNWEQHKKLHLNEKYNVFANYVDFYIERLGYSFEDLAVIHFIGKQKPWMMGEEQKKEYISNCNKEQKKYQIKVFCNYLDILETI